MCPLHGVEKQFKFTVLSIGIRLDEKKNLKIKDLFYNFKQQRVSSSRNKEMERKEVAKNARSSASEMVA